MGIKRAIKNRQSAIGAAISLLEDSHIQNNKFRMGALGSGDIDTAIAILKALMPAEDNNVVLVRDAGGA